MKFTKTSVTELKLPRGKTDHFEWDDDLPGFGIRLRGDTARWIAQYRVNDQQRRESLGDIRKVSLEDARRIAKNRFAQAELGVDYIAAKEKTRAERRQRITFDELAKQYLTAKQGEFREASLERARYHYFTLCKSLGSRSIDSIKRADIAVCLQNIIAVCGKRGRGLQVKEGLGGKKSAENARANLSGLFSWAIGEGICEANPVIGTNNPAADIEPRNRVLDNAELSAVWHACLDDNFGKIVRLLVLTGCRRREIGSLEWSEINLDTGKLTIPGEKIKNHHVLELTLPPMAIDILRSVRRHDGQKLVFGRRGPFNGWSDGNTALNARITESLGNPLPSWTLHDIRRTARTGLSKLGIAPHVAERVVNHTKKGMDKVYDQYDFGPEIKTALLRWADHVASIVEGRETKVVSLKRA